MDAVREQDNLISHFKEHLAYVDNESLHSPNGNRLVDDSNCLDVMLWNWLYQILHVLGNQFVDSRRRTNVELVQYRSNQRFRKGNVFVDTWDRLIFR